jgi:hypothetical protein
MERVTRTFEHAPELVLARPPLSPFIVIARVLRRALSPPVSRPQIRKRRRYHDGAAHYDRDYGYISHATRR